ncbi:MAG: PEP-CTERM sorting domain-containing protein [Gemmatimonadaceae bacterium]|nr:PEP-CTERM sorting domain-containing protein [Gemmatimonadaceae bacterium]
MIRDLRKPSLLALAATVAATFAAPTASAQLTPTRVDACFQTGTNTSTTSHDGTPCSSSSDWTRWIIPGNTSPNRPDDYFNFSRATPGALTFDANTNLSNAFNLGYFTFEDVSNCSYGYSCVHPTSGSNTLRLQLDFSGFPGEVTYDLLTVNFFGSPTQSEAYSFSGGGWSNWFTVDGEDYRFAVVGFDTPHPGSAANYCKSYDAIPTANGTRYDTGDGGKLCGQFERKVSQVAEPATLTLVAAGFVGLVGVARRRRDEV